MNQLLRLLSSSALCLLTLAAPALRAAPEAANTPKAKLTFVDCDKFSDSTVASMTAKGGSDLIFGELSRHLSALARQHLAPGQTLVVNMRDIDLAGAVEPWRGPDFGRVRYMRDTQPPRLAFDYQLLDESGAVVKSGSEKLTNLTFRYQQPTTDRETTYYEKQLLTDWMSATFGSAPKAKKKSP